jgi:transposase
MKDRQRLLSNEQWALVEPLLPLPRRRADNRGRPQASNRACFEGILWILQTGAAWRFLPKEFPSPSTCWRRLQQWEEKGILVASLANTAGGTGPRGSAALGRSLSRRQLRPGQKGGSAVGKTKRGKGTKWMVLVDGEGVPLGVRLESASPNEVTLAEATLQEVRVPRSKGRPRQKPERVIADRGYDSDPLRRRFRRRGIDLIVPYRDNNQQRRYEDGRKLRRYKRRWIVERTHAWLGQFRRLLVRHEHLLSTYRAFFYIACLWITLRRCF